MLLSQIMKKVGEIEVETEETDLMRESGSLDYFGAIDKRELKKQKLKEEKIDFFPQLFRKVHDISCSHLPIHSTRNATTSAFYNFLKRY